MNERKLLLHPWLLAVLVLDQFLKGVAPLLLVPGERVQLLAGVYYIAAQTAAGVAAPERLRLLVIVLLAVLVLLRIQQRGGSGEYLDGPALPLLLGGLASNLIDVLLLRQRLGLFELGFPHAQILVSLADVAVAAGALLVVVGLSRRASMPAPVELPLRESPPVHVDLEPIGRGIDNVRVDVHLSPQLVDHVRELISAILAPQIWWEPWRSAEPSANPRNLDALRLSYRDVVDAALHRAAREHQPSLVALAQLATIQLVRQEVTTTFEQLVREFRRDLDQDRQRGTRTLARLQQHLHSLRQRKGAIIEHAAGVLLEQLQRVETAALQETRRSMLGTAPGLPSRWLENPMLAAEDPDNDLFLMRHYVLLGHRADDATRPARIESLLRDWLGCNSTAAETSLEPTTEPGAIVSRHETCAWLDEPGNADLLLGVEATAEALTEARRRADAAARGALRRRLAYQRALLRRLEHGLRGAGLLPMVLAAYQLADIWDSLALPVNPRVLLRYLADPAERRRLGPRLQRLDRGESPGTARQHLDAAVQRMERMSSRERAQCVFRFVRDFLRYRRDLKQLRMIRGWSDQIRLLSTREELRLARSNHTVQELYAAADQREEQQPVVSGHVIVKADLRGSTSMTAQLSQRGLNPATHFSINFFEPIGSLIELYGARKVFVEGDAIILALLEHEGETSQLCVARACGLARSIIEVVSAHNSTGAQCGLPALELGIGVSYERGAPAWLFDDEQPIMISAAIGRADRLSSCAAFLRKEAASFGNRRLQVYQAVGRTPVDQKEGATTFRYNVDGIELEAGAFHKLEHELHLSLLELPGPDPRKGKERFYRGRYPDARGVMRNLVIREGRIRRYDRRQGPIGDTSQPFFEVVVDAEVISTVLAANAASRSG